MRIVETKVKDVLLIYPKIHVDPRGTFVESYNNNTLVDRGITLPTFVQDNYSVSIKKYTTRGLHFQKPPKAQDKLVTCMSGSILDIVVDIRKDSPTYGEVLQQILTDKYAEQLFVPAGFLHGFIALEAYTKVFYKCSNYYDNNLDSTVSFADLVRIPVNALLSSKDAKAIKFCDFESPF